MRAVVQRAASASVAVNGKITGSIGRGLVVLLGIHHDDTKKDTEWMADKLVNLRIFEDTEGWKLSFHFDDNIDATHPIVCNSDGSILFNRRNKIY